VAFDRQLASRPRPTGDRVSIDIFPESVSEKGKEENPSKKEES
jgi:hypothetical protein